MNLHDIQNNLSSIATMQHPSRAKTDDTVSHDRFEFGKNWQHYLDKYLTEDRIAQARSQTLEFLNCASLEGKSFLDIGCGSGLFSYVAYLSGAQSIVSFDYDAQSVSATEQVRHRAGDPPNWRVMHGSVLSHDFMNRLPASDIVYSWGVLHHTGDMWNAIRNAASKVKPNGLFDIAIYNKQEYRTLKEWRGSHFWLKVKRLYNSGGAPARLILESIYRGKEITAMLVRGKNPLTEIEAHSSRRGMSWSVDVTDWIGGLPFEFASVDEIFKFCHQEFGFQLVNIESTISLGCNQFLFRRPL